MSSRWWEHGKRFRLHSSSNALSLLKLCFAQKKKKKQTFTPFEMNFMLSFCFASRSTLPPQFSLMAERRPKLLLHCSIHRCSHVVWARNRGTDEWWLRSFPSSWTRLPLLPLPLPGWLTGWLTLHLTRLMTFLSICLDEWSFFYKTIRSNSPPTHSKTLLLHFTSSCSLLSQPIDPRVQREDSRKLGIMQFSDADKYLLKRRLENETLLLQTSELRNPWQPSDERSFLSGKTGFFIDKEKIELSRFIARKLFLISWNFPWIFRA